MQRPGLVRPLKQHKCWQESWDRKGEILDGTIANVDIPDEGQKFLNAEGMVEEQPLCLELLVEAGRGGPMSRE